MKNQIILVLTIIGMALNLTSCSSEDIMNPAEQEVGTVHLNVSIPSEEIRTRGYGDGNTISVLKCYVYGSGATTPTKTETINLTTTNGKKGGSLGLDLPTGGVYDFVFVATAGSHDNESSSKVYYNPTNRTISLNYAKIVGNDEDVDCFFGVLKDVSMSKGSDYTVTLKRPYAQLNIGTKDLNEYNNLATSPLKTVSVTVDGVYNSMNVMDGKVAGNPVKVMFPASAAPSGEIFPVSGNDYLAMEYLLVNERKNVAISMTVNNGTGSFKNDYDNIPVQRNYKTILYGNLLTKDGDISVEINPAFKDNSDFNVDDRWSNYDIVIKMSNIHATLTCNLTVVYEDDSEETFDLMKYIDSTKTIACSWKDLGVNSIKSFKIRSPYMSDLLKFDISKFRITSLISSFLGCQYLTNAPAINNWDTSNVTSMSDMFNGCSNLKILDLTNWDTSNVTSMSYMFFDCQLHELYANNWNTSKVTDMNSMFYKRMPEASFDVLEISNWDTSNVTDMSSMFRGQGGSSLVLNLSYWDVSKVENMSNMFQGTSLAELKAYNWNTVKVTNMSKIFYQSSISKLDLSNWDTSNVTDMSSMFENCTQLTNLVLMNWDTSKVSDMSSMFYGCKVLNSLDVSSFNTSKVETMKDIFRDCEAITQLDLSNWDTSNVTDMSHMFYHCYALSNLTNNFNTSKVTNMSYMFGSCSKLYSYNNLNCSNWDTSNVTDMNHMFYQCVLTSFNNPNWDTRNVTDMSSMFEKCAGAYSINISSFNTPKLVNISNMFYGCGKLTKLDLSNFNTSKVENMQNTFNACKVITEINLSNWDTSNVTSMSNMFNMCNKITSLDLSSFTIPKVSDMSSMFAYCYKLTTLIIPNFYKKEGVNTTYMFLNVPAEAVPAWYE